MYRSSIGLAFKVLACSSVLFLCACSQSLPVASSQLTPQMVLDAPWSFNGSRVRMTGEFDECNSYQCQLCTDGWRVTDGDNNKNCLGVSFRHGLSDEQYVRFTTATIEGDYRANCAGVPDPTKAKPGELGEVHVCTDRATQLEEASVVRIITRRPATEGRLEFYGIEPLVRANANDEVSIKSAFRENVSVLNSGQAGIERRVYLFTKDDLAEEADGLDAEGALCVCLRDKCAETDWPTLTGHTRFGDFDNPYRCWRAEKVQGTWRFPIQ